MVNNILNADWKTMEEVIQRVRLPARQAPSAPERQALRSIRRHIVGARAVRAVGAASSAFGALVVWPPGLKY